MRGSSAEELAQLVSIFIEGMTGWHTRDLRLEHYEHLEQFKEIFFDAEVFANLLGKVETLFATKYLELIIRAFGEAVRRYWNIHNKHSSAQSASSWQIYLQDNAGGEKEELENRLKNFIWEYHHEKHEQILNNEWKKFPLIMLKSPIRTTIFRILFHNFLENKQISSKAFAILEEDRKCFFGHYLHAYRRGLFKLQTTKLYGLLIGLAHREPLISWQLLAHHFANKRSETLFFERSSIAFQKENYEETLEDLFIEPAVEIHWDIREEKEEFELLFPTKPHFFFDIIEEVLNQHNLVIVTAPSGYGKTMTAQTLAWRFAESFLEDPSKNTLPILIDCERDIEGKHFDFSQILQRSLEEHGIHFSFPWERPKFSEISKEQPLLLLFEQFEALKLTHSELVHFLAEMNHFTSSFQRIIIFSREEGLPDHAERKGIPVIELQAFSTEDANGRAGGQIGQWLQKWHRIHPNNTLPSPQQLQRHQLLDIARHPFNLYMLVRTWKMIEKRAVPPVEIEIYTIFIRQMLIEAQEKAAQQGGDELSPLQYFLYKLLPPEHSNLVRQTDALMQLLTNIAWNAHNLRKSGTFSFSYIVNFVKKGLNLDLPKEIIRSLCIDILLICEPASLYKEEQVFFGHQAIREFLVASYWEDKLKLLLKVESSKRRLIEKKYLKGRFLLPKDRSFHYLLKLIERWDESLREELYDWATECFNDEKIGLGVEELREDYHPFIRESALAIGSLISAKGLKMKDERTFRSFLTWFWLQEEQPVIKASHLRSPRALLRRVDLMGANLEGASLEGSNFIKADLRDVNLTASQLTESSFIQADLRGGDFTNACLDRVDMRGADLRGATLEGANIREADFSGANLRIANLRGADFSLSDMRECNFFRANLEQAYFREADLRGAIFKGANLRGADLRGARLSGADFRQADLRDCQIDEESWEETLHDEEMKFPQGEGLFSLEKSSL